jgi:hypothetical protein
MASLDEIRVKLLAKQEAAVQDQIDEDDFVDDGCFSTYDHFDLNAARHMGLQSADFKCIAEFKLKMLMKAKSKSEDRLDKLWTLNDPPESLFEWPNK